MAAKVRQAISHRRSIGLPQLIGLSLVLASARADAAPVDAAFYAQLSSSMAAATPGESIVLFRGALPNLRAAEAAAPGLSLGDVAADISANDVAAVLDEASALAALQAASQAVDPKRATLAVLPEVLRPMFELARGGPDNALGLYALGLAIVEGEGEGLSAVDITGKDPDPADLLTYNKAVEAQGVNSDAASLEAASLDNDKVFITGIAKLIPPGLAPGLTSPTGVFFGDLIKWNHDMWSTSTDGVTLVSNAIQTGKLDMAAYEKITKHLATLGRQGPWTQQSGIDFLKQVASGIPGVGKFLPALWNSFSRANGTGVGLPAVPTATAASGQLSPQSFGLDLGGGATATLTASPGYQVFANGAVSIGLVKITTDALPPFLHTDAPAESGEEAHRWLAYPEQQVSRVTVDYDSGSADAPSDAGAFEVQTTAPTGATRVIGIDVTFAPIGGAVVLHWPANISIR